MFSIKESILYGWNKVKEHMELLLFATLSILATGGLIGGISEYKQSINISIFWIIGAIFLVIIRIGYNKILLRIHDGENPKFTDIFKEYKTFWKYFAVSILFQLIVLLGLIFFIIPGIILLVRLSFSLLIVIDTKIGPITAMKESRAITKDSFLKLFFFWIIIVFINFIGLMIFGIGLLITIPMTTLAVIHVYRTLSQKKASFIQRAFPQIVLPSKN